MKMPVHNFDEHFAAKVISHILSKNGFTPDLAKYNFVYSHLPLDNTETTMLGETAKFLSERKYPIQTVEMFLNLINSDVEALMNKEACDDYLLEKSLSKDSIDEYILRFDSSRNTLVQECAQIINQFPLSIKNQVNFALNRIIEDNFSSVQINKNKQIVIDYVVAHALELKAIDNEKEMCFYLNERIEFDECISEGEKLCYVVLAVNDYAKGGFNPYE